MKNKNVPKIRIIMGEGISKMCKFLFVHRNKHKLAFCNFMIGLHSSMRRLLLIPLLYASFTVQNPINILTLIPCLYYTYRSSSYIEDDIKFFMPVFSLVFGVMFSYEQIKKNDFFKNLISKLSSVKFESSGLSIFSGFFLVIALSFTVKIYMAYFVSFRLFIIRKKFKTLFFYFSSEDKSGKNGQNDVSKLTVDKKKHKKNKVFAEDFDDNSSSDGSLDLEGKSKNKK